MVGSYVARTPFPLLFLFSQRVDRLFPPLSGKEKTFSPFGGDIASPFTEINAFEGDSG